MLPLDRESAEWSCSGRRLLRSMYSRATIFCNSLGGIGGHPGKLETNFGKGTESEAGADFVLALATPSGGKGGRDMGLGRAAENVGRPRLAMRLWGTAVWRDGVCPIRGMKE
jgi:hypothetical protein